MPRLTEIVLPVQAVLCLLALPSPVWSAAPRGAPVDSTRQVATEVLTSSPSIQPGVESGPAGSVTLSWDVTVASKYLFQGVDCSDGKPVAQPEFGLSLRSLSANIWFNHDLDQNVSNEFDLSLLYAAEGKGISFDAGYVYLRYPHRADWSPSQEVVADLSLDAPLSPSLGLHYDFDAGKGGYAGLGLSREFALRSVTLTTVTELFYQNHYYGMNGFPSVAFSLVASRDFGPVTVAPKISYWSTWENGSFRGAGALPESWLFALQFGRGF